MTYFAKAYPTWQALVVYEEVASAWNADIPAKWDALVRIQYRDGAPIIYR